MVVVATRPKETGRGWEEGKKGKHCPGGRGCQEREGAPGGKVGMHAIGGWFKGMQIWEIGGV